MTPRRAAASSAAYPGGGGATATRQSRAGGVHGRLGDGHRGPDAGHLGRQLQGAHGAHQVVGGHELGLGGEASRHVLEPRRQGFDADPRRRGQAGDVRQRAGEDCPIPGHPVEVLERDLGRHALVPARQQVDRASGFHQHARGPERPAPGRPQRACAGGVGHGVAAAEHQHVEPDRGHGIEHPVPASRPQLGVLGRRDRCHRILMRMAGSGGRRPGDASRRRSRPRSPRPDSRRHRHPRSRVRAPAPFPAP